MAGCGAIARTTKAALEAAYDDCPSGPSKALQRAFQRRRASGAPRDALGRAHSHKHKMRRKALRTHKNTRCVGRPSALKDLAESRPDSFAAGGEQDRTHATFAHMMMVPRSPSSPFLFLIMACIDRSERRARVRASRVMCQQSQPTKWPMDELAARCGVSGGERLQLTAAHLLHTE